MAIHTKSAKGFSHLNSCIITSLFNNNITGDVTEITILYQHLSVAIQRFNAAKFATEHNIYEDEPFQEKVILILKCVLMLPFNELNINCYVVTLSCSINIKRQVKHPKPQCDICINLDVLQQKRNMNP